MRLNFLLVPMSFLILFSFHNPGFAKEKNTSSVLCPSTNIYDLDQAHLMFEIPKDLDYQSLVQISNEIIQESSDPNLHEIEVRQSMHNGKELPIFTHFTGKYKTFQFPEPEMEIIVIRPFADCLNTDIEDTGPETHVLTGAFENDILNLAVVQQLLDKDIDIRPVSKRGLQWLCTVRPEREECEDLDS